MTEVRDPLTIEIDFRDPLLLFISPVDPDTRRTSSLGLLSRLYRRELLIEEFDDSSVGDTTD